LTDYLAFVGGFLLFISAFSVSYEVFARYVLRAPTKWTFEVSILLVFVAVFTTVAFTLKEFGHVTVEAVARYFPQQTQRLLEIIAFVMIALFSVVFLRATWEMVGSSMRNGEMSAMLHYMVWPLKAVIFLSFVVLFLQALRLLVSKCREFYDHGLLRAQGDAKKTVIILAIYALCLVTSVLVFNYVNIAAGLILLLLSLLVFYVPIGFGIGWVAIMGSIAVMGTHVGLNAIPQQFYLAWNEFSMVALPLFIFLGFVMHKTGLADDMFAFARAWVGHIPGGLGIATLIVCGIFAAISGSSVANAATIGLVAIPAMLRYKYNPPMAAGLVGIGGTLGVLIPPSTGLLLIGVITGESIAKLFMAGVLPGILAIIFLSLMTMFLCKRNKDFVRLPKEPMKERTVATRKALPALLMPVFMVVGIYSGVFTATECAGVAVVYALVYSVFSRRVKIRDIGQVITESTKTVGMMTVLVAAGMALSNVTAMMQVPQRAAALIIHSGWGGAAFIVATMVLVIILGMFLDGGAITILTIPILYPIVNALGYNMIWYAIIFIMCTEIGLLTPPVGMNAFVVASVSKIPFMDVVKGSIPFLLIMILMMLLVAFIPGLALWIPSTM
jgi:C4-dicarboxylate transporter DctM subunit